MHRRLEPYYGATVVSRCSLLSPVAESSTQSKNGLGSENCFFLLCRKHQLLNNYTCSRATLRKVSKVPNKLGTAQDRLFNLPAISSARALHGSHGMFWVLIPLEDNLQSSRGSSFPVHFSRSFGDPTPKKQLICNDVAPLCFGHTAGNGNPGGGGFPQRQTGLRIG